MATKSKTPKAKKMKERGVGVNLPPTEAPAPGYAEPTVTHVPAKTGRGR
jgi:hypothetical protein